jgi:hypothetical protein
MQSTHDFNRTLLTFLTGMATGVVMVLLLWVAASCAREQRASKATLVGAAPSRNAVAWRHVGGQR